MNPFHPELRGLARFLPRGPMPAMLKLIRAISPTRQKAPRQGRLQVIGDGQVLRIHSPTQATGPTGLMLWLHGGGFVIGSPSQDDGFCRRFVDALGITVVAPTYRLAPEHPFPTPMEDAYRALEWVHDHAAELNGRPDRIVIAGASAGGGLAAGLTLLARDRKKIPVAAQVLVYPMLDDRSVRPQQVSNDHRLWNVTSNVFGWKSYLGEKFGSAEVPIHAAPARAIDLRGLPPTWIGVGSLDLFHDEDLEYARRLKEAGIPVELEVVPGAFHGFDAVRSKSKVAREFFDSQVRMLRRVLA